MVYFRLESEGEINGEGTGRGIVIVRGNIRVVNEARCTSTNTGGGVCRAERERERLYRLIEFIRS